MAVPVVTPAVISGSPQQEDPLPPLDLGLEKPCLQQLLGTHKVKLN